MAPDRGRSGRRAPVCRIVPRLRRRRAGTTGLSKSSRSGSRRRGDRPRRRRHPTGIASALRYPSSSDGCLATRAQLPWTSQGNVVFQGACNVAAQWYRLGRTIPDRIRDTGGWPQSFRPGLSDFAFGTASSSRRSLSPVPRLSRPRPTSRSGRLTSCKATPRAQSSKLRSPHGVEVNTVSSGALGD